MKIKLELLLENDLHISEGLIEDFEMMRNECEKEVAKIYEEMLCKSAKDGAVAYVMSCRIIEL